MGIAQPLPPPTEQRATFARTDLLVWAENPFKLRVHVQMGSECSSTNLETFIKGFKTLGVSVFQPETLREWEILIPETWSWVKTAPNSRWKFALNESGRIVFAYSSSLTAIVVISEDPQKGHLATCDKWLEELAVHGYFTVTSRLN